MIALKGVATSYYECLRKNTNATGDDDEMFGGGDVRIDVEVDCEK